MAQSYTPDQLEALLQYASKKLGTTPEKLKQTVSDGGVDALTSSLSPQEAARMKAVVGDQKKAEEFLSSPQARQLIEKMLGGQKK
ncbi:MAG: hypothetical protein HFJ80_00670 [Clostridiales bacterium]|nr:hypothetical protein [Clostridiales bacterium]